LGNPAERALLGVAIGRKNYLFAGSDAGGRRAAAMYSLIETAKLNGINPQAYLTDVLSRIADHPAKRVARTAALELATRRFDPRRRRRPALLKHDPVACVACRANTHQPVLTERLPDSARGCVQKTSLLSSIRP
jgi:hypothetical protein